MRPSRTPTMRSKQRSARSTACRLVTSVPWRARASSTSSCTVASASVGSSAETGSSASSSSGAWYSVRAMPTRCSWPPESWSQRLNSLSASSSRASVCCAPAMSWGYASDSRLFHHGHWPSLPASTLVTTRWRAGSGGAWCTMPMRLRSWRSARPLGTVSHRSRTCPLVGTSAEPSTPSSELLPAPDGPTSARHSPCRADSVMSLRPAWPLA